MKKKIFSSAEIRILKKLCEDYKHTGKGATAFKPDKKTNNHFSDTEIRVMDMICKELTSLQIASKMKLTEKRIEKIRASLMKKTESRNIVGIVKYAIKYGIYKL